MDIYHKDTEESIAQRILSYLMNRPESKDTLEGIAEWWLERAYIEESVDMVRHGLFLLCSQGLVVEEKGLSKISYYKLNGTNGTISKSVEDISKEATPSICIKLTETSMSTNHHNILK